ncbi:AMP-binding protein [Nocardia gipuzkoensis]
MNTALHLGASLSLLSRFDTGRMLEMVRADEITLMSGVPTMWNAMLHAGGDFGPEQFGSLRMASPGGASLPWEVIRAFRCERLPIGELGGGGRRRGIPAP